MSGGSARATEQTPPSRRGVARLARDLAASEQRWRTLVTHAPVVLFALDSKGVITVCEGLGLRTLGQSPGVAVGRSVFEILPDNPTILAHIRAALAGEERAGIVDVAGVVYDARYTPMRGDDGGDGGGDETSPSPA